MADKLQIPMTSAKGVLLKTEGKLCEKDIVVTPTFDIPEAANIQPLTITENGTYTAQDGVDGYSPITVEVASGGEDLLGALIDRSITEANSGVTSIGDRAFINCSKLTSANFPNATSISTYAFSGCSSLTSANFPNATSINDYAFYSCTNLPNANFPNLTSIGASAFYDCSSLTSANFPNATSIGASAFEGCSKLTSVDFPNVTSIVSRAFQLCSSLTNANIPNATSIGASAFNSCSKLTSVDFPNVTSIGNYAFRVCSSLTNANIPNLTSISTYAFDMCYLLVAVILRSKTVCTLGSNVFSKCYHILGTKYNPYNPNGDNDGYIYVPLTLVDTYKEATNWSAHASQIMPYVDTLAELSDIDATTYNKAYVGDTEKEYTYNGTEWEEYTR